MAFRPAISRFSLRSRLTIMRTQITRISHATHRPQLRKVKLRCRRSISRTTSSAEACNSISAYIESPSERMRHAAPRIDFPLELFLPQAHQGEDHAQQHDGQHLPAEDRLPIRRETAAAPEYRLRMLRAPPLDGEDYDGHVDKREDRKHRREGGALRGFFDGVAQHQVAGVQQPADQGRRQACVPGPPYAPGDTSPDGSGD